MDAVDDGHAHLVVGRALDQASFRAFFVRKDYQIAATYQARPSFDGKQHGQALELEDWILASRSDDFLQLVGCPLTEVCNL